MKTIAAREVAAVFESIAPMELGLPGDQLGFIYGNADAAVHAVACMWQANTFSLREAVKLGAGMIVVHEAIFDGHQVSPWYDGPKTPQDIRNNRLRKGILDNSGLVVYRSHSNWDALPVDSVVDQAVSALKIGGLKAVGGQKFFRVYQLAAPMSVRELAAKVESAIGIEPRMFGPRDRTIARFCFLVGGFGGNQWHIAQPAVEMGAEAIIIGEMTESIVVAAMECGATAFA